MMGVPRVDAGWFRWKYPPASVLFVEEVVVVVAASVVLVDVSEELTDEPAVVEGTTSPVPLWVVGSATWLSVVELSDDVVVPVDARGCPDVDEAVVSPSLLVASVLDEKDDVA